MEVHDGARAPPCSDEQADRPEGATARVFEQQTPNSSPKDSFPPINFTVGDLPSSAREDSERRGHVLVFQSIGGLLVQFSGSASIVGLRENLNEEEEEVN